MNPIPRAHKYLFWVILASYSTFFAEVFAGSDLFPFFRAWGLLVEVPLYGLHLVILITLIYRFGGRPRFETLVFAGALFGLYEAYTTKVLWQPGWDVFITLGNVAVIETLLLVFWWHTWLSFITPLVLGEGLLTRSRYILVAFPLRLRRFYGSWKGWLAIALFGAAFQAVNSPSPLHSLASGASTVGVLTLLTLIWMRVTRGQAYDFPDLLPSWGEFAALAVWLGGIYIYLGFAIFPERIPPFWPGQAIILGLYALVIALLMRPLRRGWRLRLRNRRGWPVFPTAKSLLGTGAIFILTLPLAKLLLGRWAEGVALVGWLVGIALGMWAFLRAVRDALPRWRRKSRPKIRWVKVGNGQMTLYHRPKSGDMRALKSLGVTHLVTLLSEREGAQGYGHAAKAHGIEWIWLPMPNANYPESEVNERLAAAMPRLARLLDEGAHLLIHCSAGIHRTGMVSYGLLRWRGYTSEQAMQVIRKMREVTAEGMKPKRQKWGDNLISAREQGGGPIIPPKSQTQPPI